MHKWSTLWGELTEQERSSLAAALPAFEKLTKVLEKKYQANAAAQEKSSNYDSPSWAVRQADYIGTQRAIKDIQSIITPSVNKT